MRCPFAHSKTAYQAQKFSKVCHWCCWGHVPHPPFLFCAPARDMCPLSMGENGFLRNWVFVDLFMLGSFSLTYFCWECLAVMRQTLLRPRYCVCVWVIYMYVLCVCVFLCVYVCVCVCVCVCMYRELEFECNTKTGGCSIYRDLHTRKKRPTYLVKET